MYIETLHVLYTLLLLLRLKGMYCEYVYEIDSGTTPLVYCELVETIGIVPSTYPRLTYTASASLLSTFEP